MRTTPCAGIPQCLQRQGNQRCSTPSWSKQSPLYVCTVCLLSKMSYMAWLYLRIYVDKSTIVQKLLETSFAKCGYGSQKVSGLDTFGIPSFSWLLFCRVRHPLFQSIWMSLLAECSSFKVGLSLSLTPNIISLQPRHLTHCTVIFQKKVQNEAWPGAYSSLTHRGIQKWAPGEAGPWADLYSVHLVVGKISPSMWVTGVGDDTLGTLVLSPAWCVHLTPSLRGSPW